MRLPLLGFSRSTRLIALFALLLGATTVHAQTGGIRGTIYEPMEDNAGDSIPAFGVVVQLDGPTKAEPVQTDFDGAFEFKNLQPGTYRIYLSGAMIADTLRGIDVEPGEVARVDRTLGASEDVLEGVLIVVAREKGTEVAVIKELKERESLGDGISKEQISKGGDRTVGAAVTRIPGVTLLEGKFLVVRGLGQRYNAVQLNGINAPYTEPEQRGFALDIIPTTVVDRLLVFKTGTPDMPGDFAGSVLEVYTKSYVDEPYHQLTFGTGYRVGTTFKNDFGFITSYSGDVFGFGKGSRGIPASAPQNLNSIEVNDDRRYDVTKDFGNDWALDKKTAMPDLRFTYEQGNKFNMGNTKVTNVNLFRYSNTRTYFESKLFRWQYDGTIGGDRTPLFAFEGTDRISQQEVSITAMSNWQFRLSPYSKIEFKSFLNQQGLSEGIEREAASFLFTPAREELNYSLHYLQRTLWANQLTGSHTLSQERATLKWGLGFALTLRDEPDWRRARTTRIDGTDDPYQVILPPSAALFDAARFFSDLNETQYTHRLDYERLLAPNVDSIGIKVRAGYYVELKQRDFLARWTAYTRANTGTFDPALLQLPLTEIFGPENINVNGFVLQEGTNPTDQYESQTLLTAGYVGAYLPLFGDKVKVSGGVRVESYALYLEPGTGAPARLTVDTNLFAVLPFVNTTYAISEKFQIRGAYSNTINRPELREFAEYNFYDFVLNANFVGNSSLKPADINNFDLRFEFYPSEGEAISIGGFYKDFTNPIELNVNGTENAVYTYENSKSAYSTGIEIEVRKSLRFLSPTGFFSHLGVLFNGALIYGRVDVGDRLNAETNRPLQGQSPYVVNGGLFYQNDSTGWGVNVLYNTYGKRIFSVGDVVNLPTVWELPRHFVDVSVNKDLSEKTNLKVTANNILDTPYRLFNDGNSDGKNTVEGVDVPIREFRQGQYITAELSVKF